MKKVVGILYFIFMIFCISIGIDLTYAKSNNNLIDDILKGVSGNTIECGVRYVIQPDSNGREIYTNIVRDLKETELTECYFKNENEDTVELSGTHLGKPSKGFIKYFKSGSKEYITINILENTERNNLNELNKSFMKTFSKYSSNVKSYAFVKAELKEKDIENVNNEVLIKIRANGGSDISTVKINNGFSTTAYTGKYNSEYVGKRLVDFNVAVCSYSSGNYIVIGTPIIISSY